MCVPGLDHWSQSQGIQALEAEANLLTGKEKVGGDLVSGAAAKRVNFFVPDLVEGETYRKTYN